MAIQRVSLRSASAVTARNATVELIFLDPAGRSATAPVCCKSAPIHRDAQGQYTAWLKAEFVFPVDKAANPASRGQLRRMVQESALGNKRLGDVEIRVFLDEGGLELIAGFNVMDHIVARGVMDLQDGPNGGCLPLWNGRDSNDTCDHGIIEVSTEGLGSACRAVATEAVAAKNFSSDLDVSCHSGEQP